MVFAEVFFLIFDKLKLDIAYSFLD
jgi:hypothetical protein